LNSSMKSQHYPKTTHTVAIFLLHSENNARYKT
jgi:hypothetical protein